MFAAAAAAACNDPSLRVELSYPAGVSIDHTAITVYESATANCEDVEFALLDDAQLRALEVSELVVDRDNRPIRGGLTSISRVGNKLIVARGFASDDSLVAEGCSPKGEIVDDDLVVVELFDVAVVSVGEVGSDQRIGITLTKPSGQPLASREVRWRVYGPQGTSFEPGSNATAVADQPFTWEPTQPECTNDEGRIVLLPVPPAQVAGYAFDVRASWAASAPRLSSAFSAALPSLPTPLAAPGVCAVRGTSSASSLVCLSGDNAIEFSIAVANGQANLTEASRQTITGAFDLVTTDRGNGTRDVFALASVGAATHLIEVRPGGGGADRTFPQLAGPVHRSIGLPACGSQPAQLAIVVDLVAQPGKQFVQLRNLTDLKPQPTRVIGDQLTFNNSDCVAEGAVLRQAVGVNEANQTTGELTTKLYFDCDRPQMELCAIDIAAAGAAIGFTDRADPRVISAGFDASGVVLTSSVLLAGAGGDYRLVERERTSAAGFPTQFASGNLDGPPSATDFAWVLGGTDATILEVAYDRVIGGERLTAISPRARRPSTQLLAFDLTADGHDDLVLVGPGGVVVIPTHVPLPPRGGGQPQLCKSK